MKFSNVYIDAIGYELPSSVVMTSDLEDELSDVYEKLNIPQGQIEEMTGIYERRWWKHGSVMSDCAAAAGRRAFEKCSVKPEDIGMLVYSGVCRDNFEPATAAAAAGKLGIGGNALVFDIGSACLGVINGIIEVASHIELGHIKAGMVISSESAREINTVTIEKMKEFCSIDFFLQSIAVLTGGSGAVGVIVTDGSFGNMARRIRSAAVKSASEFSDLCRWGMEKVSGCFSRMFMLTDSSGVLKNGIKLAEKTWKAFLNESGWKKEDIGRTICHQVGSAHQNGLLKTLGLSPEKDFATYPYLGNIGTVSLPITAAIAEERGVLHEGMKTVLMGIGSGLNCMMIGVEW